MEPTLVSQKTNFSSTPFINTPGRGMPVVVRNLAGRNDATFSLVATSTYPLQKGACPIKDWDGKIVIGAVCASIPRCGRFTSFISAKLHIGQCQVAAVTITCPHLVHLLPIRRASRNARKKRECSPKVCW